MKLIFQNFMKYRFLLFELVKKGIKLRYRRSYLGIIWTLLEPLFMMGVLTFVFDTILNRDGVGDMYPVYPVYILCGRLCFSFFNSATTSCLKSIRRHSGMIKKVYVPKYLYPLSEVLYNYVIFMISLIVLVVVACCMKVFPSFTWLLTVIPLIQLFLLSFGVGMILATIGVFFRDMEYLWTVATTLIMYTSAIFYYIDSFGGPGDWKVKVLQLNPLYCVITNFRNCIFGHLIDWNLFTYSTIFSLVCIVVGVFVFFKKQDKFILEI
ncbi:MAG: ABC transporter permease [Ruminococcaceae bacterium]|nr:ABC transporter permease [Oscillospiraceae bacterium]